MKTKIFASVLFLLLVACGSTKNISSRDDIKLLSAKKIIKQHYKNQFKEKTFASNLKVRFEDDKKSQSLSISLRILKDEKIWMSFSVFGFTVAKALITPEEVQFYNKMNKTYFQGDFSVTKEMLGAELNFNMLQNLLLGDAITPLSSKSYSASIENKSHLLTLKKEDVLLDMRYWVHPLNFKVEKQSIEQIEKQESISIAYRDYKKYSDSEIPQHIELLLKGATNNVQIELAYKSIKVGTAITFPYKIPSDYKRTFLNQ
ncbi:MAG: DUF4292 domain-containing protein [Flavicella sp.]